MFGMKPDGTVAGRRNRRGDMTVSAVDWLVLLGTVVILFAVDLTVATLRPHAVGFREATLWSVFFVAVAVGFGFVLAALEGWGYAGQYFAGYIVEKSLSIDNLFVFVIIMTSFAVPREHQQRVLIFGIIASLCLRAAFIAVGAALLSALSFMFLIFGLVLVWTAFRLFTTATPTLTWPTAGWCGQPAGSSRSLTTTTAAG
jgi:tellurite resistance protein TerC